MNGGARRDWERQGISKGGAGRSETERAEYSTGMWGTESVCTGRAEGARRNIRMNEGWQIWWGYDVELLKSKEGDFEVDVSWDWKPQKGASKGGLSWTAIWNTWQHEQVCFEFSVCERDTVQTGIGIVQPGRDKSVGNKIGCAFSENWSNVTKGANVIKTGFRKSRDVWVKRKRLVESDTKEFDLGCEWNSGAWDVDWAECWEGFQPLAGTE